MLLVTARVLGLNPGYFYILSIFEIYIYINKNFCIFQKKSLKLSKNQTGWMKLKLLCSMKYLWNNTDFSLILHWQKISRKSGKFLGYRSGALNSLSIERIREGLKIVKLSLSFGFFSLLDSLLTMLAWFTMVPRDDSLTSSISFLDSYLNS